MVRLNQAVAVAMTSGPAAETRLLDAADSEDRMAGHYRFDAVRAQLQEMAGDLAAAGKPTARPRGQPPACRSKRYLEGRASRLMEPTD